MQSTQRLRWLIASTTDGKTEVLSLDDGGRRVLPVFSVREEAQMYARLQLGTTCWRPRMYSAGEILSLLYGPLADVASVALDPLPEVCDRTSLFLVSVSRRPFVSSLLKEGRDVTSRGASRREHGAASEVLRTNLGTPPSLRPRRAGRQPSPPPCGPARVAEGKDEASCTA